MKKVCSFISAIIAMCVLMMPAKVQSAPQQPLVILTLEKHGESFSVAGEPLFREGYLPRGKPLTDPPFVITLRDHADEIFYKTGFDFPWLARESSAPVRQETVTLTLPWPSGVERINVIDRGGKILLDHAMGPPPESQSSEESGYVFVAGEGDPNFALKFLFLGDEYNGDVALFAAHVEEQVAQILKTSPFSQNKKALIFYRMSSVDLDLGCMVDDVLTICDSVAVQAAAAGMPYDEIVVSVNRPQNNYNGPIGLATFFVAYEPHPATYAVTSSFDPLVPSHEIGHSSFALMDEYLLHGEGSEGTPYGPNCDYAGCENFQEISNAGCFPGCGFSNLFRAASSGCVMYDLSDPEEPAFCPVCSPVINTILSQYDGEGDGTTDDGEDTGDDDGDETGDDNEEGDDDGEDTGDDGDNDDEEDACEAAKAAYDACLSTKSVFACKNERHAYMEACL
jgi:hypothetical protein